MTAKTGDELIADARSTAKKLLRKDRPQRWLHTQGVASRAAGLAGTIRKPDRPVLIAAGWLHDIGYAQDIQVTGFHELDGAIYLQEHGWDQRIAALVAHHSGARFFCFGRHSSVLADFEFIEDRMSDALTYADQTVGPHGKKTKIQDRIAETKKRNGPNSPNAQARIDREPYLLAVAQRMDRRLAELKGK